MSEAGMAFYETAVRVNILCDSSARERIHMEHETSSLNSF